MSDAPLSRLIRPISRSLAFAAVLLLAIAWIVPSAGADPEDGPGANQGQAQHDPDDDGRGPDRSNGGVDQPGGSGGVDQTDQDGNNGCGNDDDFEDDNEGLCLGRQGDGAAGTDDEGDVDGDLEVEDDTTDDTTDGTIVEGDDESTTGGDEEQVLDTTVDDSTDGDAQVAGTSQVQTGGDDGGAEVLGMRLTRTPSNQAAPAVGGEELARTGSPALLLTLLATALLGLGAAATRWSSRTRRATSSSS